MTLINSTRSEIGMRRVWAAFAGLVALGLTTGLWSVPTRAQTFSSGSDGSDGALTLAQNLGTVTFDPNDTARWGRVLDADGDGVYNFTTISIGSGTTVRIGGDKIPRPVYWLASGDVTIGGVIDLRGAGGTATLDLGGRRQLAVPGSGGFSGGAGALVGSPVPPTPGDGPGGGQAAVLACNGGAPNRCGAGGSFSGNRYLISLYGGSGGGGGLWNNGNYYGGGAGGGAILLASSTSISFNNGANANILANGGSGASDIGGGGSGGAIRLVAPSINAGNAGLDVRGGPANGIGGSGAIRIERFVQTGVFNFSPNSNVANVGSPVDASTLRPAALVRVAAVAGIRVSSSPTGSFVIPDVSISNSGPVAVDIEATGIPVGTTVTLQVYPQSPDDVTTINMPAVQTTLSGTVEHSTATVNFVFPYGFSRGTLRATWQ